jgi:hypothetical protein
MITQEKKLYDVLRDELLDTQRELIAVLKESVAILKESNISFQREIEDKCAVRMKIETLDSLDSN